MSKIIDENMNLTYDMMREIQNSSDEMAGYVSEYIKKSGEVISKQFHDAATARMYVLILIARHYPVDLEFHASVEERENVLKIFEGKKFKMNQTNHEDGSFDMQIEIIEDEDES